MKMQNGGYGPRFKFMVVVEALRAEVRGVEAGVGPSYEVHPVTPSSWKRQFVPAEPGGARGRGGGPDLREANRGSGASEGQKEVEIVLMTSSWKGR